MKLVTGDLWTYESDHPDRWVCITTNGTVNARGENIMGSGCARQLKELMPHMPKALGTRLQEKNNHVFVFEDERIVTVPTKNKWNEPSPLNLVIASCIELGSLASKHPDALYILPRPGIGAGKLAWEDVLPAIEPFLGDNVHVITWH